MTEASNALKIHPKLLLGIYAFIPFTALLCLTDIFLWNGYLKTHLATDPNSYAVFTLLFTLPHIISSFFGFIDKQYLENYKAKLLRGVRYAIIAAVVIPIVSLQLAFLVFAVLTMYHVFRQQSGIAKVLMRGVNAYHPYWEWLGIILSLGLYINIFTNYTPSIFAVYAWFAVSIIYSFIGLKASTAARTTIGRLYFWLTHLIPMLSAVFLLIGYPILSIALPRILHDLTAYTFYVTHDYNRYAAAKSNYFYKALKFTGLPVFIINPVASIALAFLFKFTFFNGLYVLLSFLFLFHYYNESFMWKSDSLHRQYIAFAK